MSDTRHIAIALEIDQPYPHHFRVFEGIEQYISEQPGWRHTIDEHPGYKLKQRGAQQHRYDGVIARADHAMQRRIKRMGIPLVNLHLQSQRAGVPAVFTDFAEAGRMAADHLIDRGFERLIVMADPMWKMPCQLACGFRERCDDRGLRCTVFDHDGVVFADRDRWLSMERQLDTLMSMIQPPTAILVDTVGATRLLVQSAPNYGFRVPQDLAVMCYHGVEELFLIRPQISSIEHNYNRVGYEAASLLHRLMDGQPAPDRPTLISPRHVIARESTDYFAVQDDVVAEALRYISPRLSEKLNVEHIAYAINVSPRLLQKRFSEALGVGVSDEVRRLRLEKAKRLLADPSRPIYSIPEKIGFATVYAMSKAFKREIGMTPGAYRQKMRSECRA